MDAVVLAVGTALVSAMATDAWQQARAAVVTLWRRARPEQAGQIDADQIDAELEVLRDQVLAARERADRDTEDALTGAWRLRLQRLLDADPALAAERRRSLAEQLLPALTALTPGQARPIMMTAEARDQSRIYMAGGDQHISGS